MHVALNLAFLTLGEMGGLEVYARQLSAALARRSDLRLTLLLGRAVAAGGSWGELGDLVVLGVDPRRRIDWVRADQLAVPRAAARVGAHLVHSLASTSPARGRLPRVVTVHDLNYLVHPEAHFGPRALGMRLLVPLAVRRAHRVIVPSESTRRDVVERLRAAPDKVDVVPEGVGQPQAGGPADAREARERLGAAGRAVVLSVSAKRPHKNLLRLIAALARIPPERRPLLVLPGYHTPHEAELRERARELGVADEVRFLGWVSEQELEGLYAAADCFAFPSLYEGFGLPVLEAMARGVPVVTSGRASLAEVAGEAALIVDPEDEASIAAALERLLGDRELAERLRAAGFEQTARFTWEAAAEGTVESYQRALAAS
jgi:glycosyltransferase involved in cell wall biosynthesis